MKNTPKVLNYVDYCNVFNSFYTILFFLFLFCVHNEFFWDGYECGERSHKYSKCKTLIMVVSKIMLPPYHHQLMKEEKITYYKYAI